MPRAGEPDGKPGEPSEAKELLLARYARLVEAMDREALHELMATRGLDVLASGLPLFLLRHHLAGGAKQRREARRADLLERYGTSPTPPRTPEEIYSEREVLERALASLPVVDALTLWWSLEGYSDEEIAARGAQNGLWREPPRPDALRQRRTRALARVRIQFMDA